MSRVEPHLEAVNWIVAAMWIGRIEKQEKESSWSLDVVVDSVGMPTERVEITPWTPLGDGHWLSPWRMARTDLERALERLAQRGAISGAEKDARHQYLEAEYARLSAPVPVGTVVEYSGSQQHGTYEITAHAEPMNIPEGHDKQEFFADGVAYEIWPVGVERRFGNRDRAVYNVRRKSIRPKERKEGAG